MSNIYEKHFSKEELNELKASEARVLKERENAMTATFATILFLSILMFISIVALILWFGKPTIFITTVVTIPNLFLIFIYFILSRDYKRLIKKYKGRINSQEKHTLL